MKKRKLKGFVLPTLYAFIVIAIFASIIIFGNNLNLSDTNYNFGTDALIDNVESVIVEDVIVSNEIEAPVAEGKAEISIHYYSKNDNEEVQRESLIYYENTYLPNTGILYTSDEAFEIKSVFAGKVVEILDDEFFGQYVVVEHLSNLRTHYYGLEEIVIEVGDEVSKGTVLGTSKNNEIINDKTSFLLEVYHNNELVNPESFIGTKITDYE